MNEYQRKEVGDFLLRVYNHGDELHHGDCIGVDVEVAELARRIGYRIVCHPPVDESLRGFFGYNNLIYSQKTHFARNRCIVDSVDFLIVVPWETSPQQKGGTWYTRDYAIKKKVGHQIFYPELLF